MERKKRLVSLSAMIEFNSSDESSEDSDFRIEDHLDESDEEDTSIENDSADSEEWEDKCDDSCNTKKSDVNTTAVKKLLHEYPPQKEECKKVQFPKILVCCVCLGDKSNDDNEIVECDNCRVTVHEDCYGLSENASVSSNGSESSKMLWFCEACRAGQENPSCELCPNFGGVLKETDTGNWVHLVCALYVPGVAFKDVDNLNNVTLFEMSYSKWGERVCSLCPDQQFAHTGVCIGCDAGLCRTYFHVTCAQKEGLLAEAQSEELNHADPFYAHCKLHSDRDASKKRKRNWLAFELQMTDSRKQYSLQECSDLPKNISFKEKFQEFQIRYAKSKTYRPQPWIPKQKMARPLTSRASTLRALSRKASLSGIDTEALAMNKAHTNDLADLHRKWHISPAFNVQYIGYYLDRNNRISSLKQKLEMQREENSKLVKEQMDLQVMYNQAVKDNNAEVALNKKLHSLMNIFNEIVSSFNLHKKLPKLHQAVGITSENLPSTSFAGKVNPLVHEEENKYMSEVRESLGLNCGTCGLATDQHLLVKCDTCLLYYHLSCLDPPLTRMPKKTKVMGWQCSECVESSSDSEMEIVNTNTPRQLRQLKGNDFNFRSPFKANLIYGIERGKENNNINILNSEVDTNSASALEQTMSNNLLNNKNQRERDQRDSTGSANSRPQKTKQECKSLKASKIDIKPNLSIMLTPCEKPPESLGEGSKSARSQKLTLTNNCHIPKIIQKKPNVSESELVCGTCKKSGTRANIVTCDECMKGFHFLCLNPPVKKSPKVRGYSWHCADCDPTESDSD